MDPEIPEPVKEYAATDNCVLCDERFPDSRFHKAEVLEEWSYFFRAVFILEQDSDPVLAKPAIIPRKIHEADVWIDKAQDPREKRGMVRICRGESDLKQAYCFHTHCWHCLKNSNGRAIPTYIFRMARSTTPLYILPSRLSQHTDGFTLCQGLTKLATDSHWHCSSPPPQSVSGHHDQWGLTAILKGVWKKLPTEIVIRIWTYLEPCVARSLLSVQGGVGDLLDRIDLSTTNSSGMARLLGDMAVHLTSIKGTKYLCGIDDGEQLLGYSDERNEVLRIKIPSHIVAIRFTIGLYGIRCIQFQGRNNSSKWIGDGMQFQGRSNSSKWIEDGVLESGDSNSSKRIGDVLEPGDSNSSKLIGDGVPESGDSNWIGVIRSQKAISHLQLFWDDLRVHRLAIPQSDSESFGDRFLWERDVPISVTDALTAETYYEHPLNHVSYHEVRGFPGWQLMRYLPLVEEGSVLYGLTIFCTQLGGIAGMGAHFRLDQSPGETKTRWTGRQAGCPIHFRMKQTEHITSVWIRCHIESSFPNPFLVVKTSEGRICTFGPYMNPSILKLLAIPRHGKICGIYYDALKLRSGHITTFGLACRPLEMHGRGDLSEPRFYPYSHPSTGGSRGNPSEPRFYPYSYPSIGGSLEGIFRSQAPLDNISAIKVCYLEDRCTGMVIRYADCSVETLGQWFESPKAHHDTLYDISDSPRFGKLRFKLSGTRKNVVVREVSTIPPSPDDPCEDGTAILKDVNYNDTLVWWFSESSDAIVSERGR